MKTVAIGDIHGRNSWKKIINREKPYDRVIFIGDYFDSHDEIPVERQLRNFHEILLLKSKETEKIVLLAGNHDYHYLPDIDEHYSGYQPLYKTYISAALSHAINKGWLQICYQYRDIIFSHAGISKTFLALNGIAADNHLQTSLNDLFKHKPWRFKFNGSNSFGDDITQSCIWIRPKSLEQDGINLRQVVGHTQMRSINALTDRVIYIDTLGHSKEYLIINQKEEQLNLSIGKL